MSKIGLIFRKEVTNAMRDRRVLLSTVIIPLLVLPAVTLLPMLILGNKERQAEETPSRIAVTGADFPELDRALRESHRFFIVPADSIQQKMRLNRLDAGVEVLEPTEGSNSVQVRVLFNATRTESRAASDKVRLVIADLSREVLARDVDTTKVNLNPVRAITVNIASEQEMAGFYLGMIVGMMAVIGLVSGGMVMAIDSTAGEKERKTLEVLLAAPITRTQIVLGKYLATLLMGMISVILMTTGYTFSLLVGIRALGESSGFGSGTFSLAPHVVPIILLVMLCVAGFVGAFEMAVAIFARSYREAQTYLSSMSVIAVIPVVFMQTMAASPPAAWFCVPLLNAMLLIRELLMGFVIPGHILNTVASSFVFAVLALRLAFSMFRRESVLLR